MKISQKLCINLKNYDVESFIERLAENCGENWRRASEHEENNEKFFCFEHIGKDGLPNPLLTLREEDQGVLCVSHIAFIESSSDEYFDKYNQLLINFKNSLVDAVITNISSIDPVKDVQLTKDEVFLEEIVGEEVADALKLFSANKSVGSSSLYYRRQFENKRWFEFLLAAQKLKKELSYALLKATLMEQGWSEEWAHDLALEFEYIGKLLDFANRA